MYKRILVATDRSSTADCAMEEAIKLADGKAKVRVVYVVEDGYPVDEKACYLIDFTALQEAVTGTGERELLFAAEKIRESGAQVEALLIQGEGECTARLIEREARKWEADVIVIGARGVGSVSTRVTLGSVANELLSGSSVPVLLVHDKPKVLSVECQPDESRARGRPALHIVRTPPAKTSG